MVKSRDTEVAIVAAPLVVLVAVVIGIWVSGTGCGSSSGRHFGSSDATLSTGSGGAHTPADTGGAPGTGGAVGPGEGGTSASAGSGGAAMAGSGGAGTGGAPGTGGAVGPDAGVDVSVDGPATTMDVHASGGAPGTGGGAGGRATGGSGSGGAASGGAGTGGAATGGAATGGAATGGAATGGAATGGAATGGAGTGGAATGGATAKCHVVINEVQTGTALGATDEFVELYNTCSLPVDLAGYSLNYRSAANNSGGADIALFVFTNDAQIPGNGFVVIAGNGFPGAAGGRFATGGLAANGGAVGVRNAAGAVIDSVSYDALTTTNIFTESFPAPNPPPTSSIVRAPDGTDTDNNSRDLTTSLLASPGASNR